MNIAALAPQPKPNPTWTGVKLGIVSSSGGLQAAALISTGALGQATGYAERADAMRAARLLTRGVDRDAAAVLDYEGRWYVQGLTSRDDIWGAWEAPLRFEASFPAMVGKVRLDSSSTVMHRHEGLVAVVDGARELRVAA